MKLTFIGAAHEVTGSCHFLQAAGKNILIDCGMEQGPDLYENPGCRSRRRMWTMCSLPTRTSTTRGCCQGLRRKGLRDRSSPRLRLWTCATLCCVTARHIQEFGGGVAEPERKEGRTAGVRAGVCDAGRPGCHRAARAVPVRGRGSRSATGSRSGLRMWDICSGRQASRSGRKRMESQRRS